LLVDDILPALAALDRHLSPSAQLAQAVERNVRWTVRKFIESAEGQARVAEGRVKVVGAIYEIRTGGVRFLGASGPTSNTQTSENEQPRPHSSLAECAPLGPKHGLVRPWSDGG
jgi:carbonic anhydrase